MSYFRFATQKKIGEKKYLATGTRQEKAETQIRRCPETVILIERRRESG